MSSNSATARRIRTGLHSLGMLVATAAILLTAHPAPAAGIRAVASASKVTPGESFGVDIFVENIPAEGLGAIQFRLNVSAPGSTVAAVSDTVEGRPADVSVSSPLTVGPPTTSRSGISDFFWSAKSSHGVLVMDNESLQNGAGLYTLGHTNGAQFPSGSGAIARFQIGTGREVAAEKIVISLSDVVLLDGRTVYPVDSNTGVTVDLKCYTQSPNLIGMSKAAAEAALSNAKLALGSIYEVDNAAGTRALNTVLIQSSNPGVTILCDTPIDLAINTAPSEVSNISALDRAGDEGGSVSLAWVPSSSSDAAGYHVYNTSGARLAEIANAASTGVELSGLPIGQASQIRVTAYDTYGNESAGSVVTATALDDVAPRIAVSGVTDNTYYPADVQPVITVQDLNLAAQVITLNGTPYAQLPISAEGSYLLKVSATDTSGNSTVKEIAFTIDKTAPVISVAGIVKNAYYNRDLNPAVSVTDANLDGFESFLNGSAYTSGAPVTAENNYQLVIQAVDKAGNRSTETYPFFIDKTGPTSTIAVGAPKFENGQLYVAGGTPFTLAGNDAGTVSSGVDKLEYRANGASWSVYQAPVTLAGLNDGTVTMDYRAVDRATNIEDYHSFAVTLDTIAPVTTLTLGQPKYLAPAGATYITLATTFTLAASDAASGVASTEYNLDGAGWSAAAPSSIPAEGSHAIGYRSTDHVANSEADKSFTAIVDNTPPVTTIAAGDPKYTAADGKLYVTAASSFTLSATDSLSGVAVTEYRIDGGSWIAYAPFTVAAEGTHTIDYYSKDNVANTETFKTITVIVDNTPPVTTINTGVPNYTAADGKRYVTGASIFTLSATDSLSGVAVTEYRIDGGSWTTYAPFSIAAEGSHMIEYRSQDNVRNTETSGSQAVLVDNTPPVTIITTGDPKYADADGKLFVSGSAVFTMSATDNLSGLARTEYRIDSGQWTAYAPFTVAAEGTHTVDYRSQDNVANLEIFKTLIVVVDNTAPVTTITTGNPKYAGADGKLYVTSAAAFTLSATDNLSGVAKTEYRIDSGAWTAYAPFTVAAEGTHTIDYRSQDNVTNLEAFKTLTVIVDNTPPVTGITAGDPKYSAVDGRLYVTEATTFTLSTTDNLSGVAVTEYRIDGGSWTAYAPFTISVEGSHTIEYRSKDNVQNTEIARTQAVIVDNTPPVSTLTVGSPQSQADGKWYISAGTGITITAADPASGVKKTEYSIDNGQWTTYTGMFTLSVQTDGNHTIRYRSLDNVDNREDSREIVVVLDKTPPQTAISGSDQLIDGVMNTVSPSTYFTLTAADPLSGVKSIFYRIDRGTWQAYTGSFSLAGMKAGQYTIGFKSIDNVLNEETEKTIPVRLIIIEVEKKIAAESIVLVGFESDKSDADQKQADIQKLSSLLASLNLSYAVSQSMDEFATALRSGRYNTYVLIDAKEPLIGEEVREAVHSGDALIFIKTKPDADPFLDDVFGVNFKGKTTSDNLTVNLQSGPISAEATLQTIGKSVVSAVTATSAQVLGTVADKQDTYPAIIFNQYDRGKVLLYTFDLLNTSDPALASALLVESLNFVRPAEGTPRPLNDMPVRITVKNSTEPVDVKVTETLPTGATADTVVPKAAAADGTLIWQKSLAVNETARFGYYLKLPDIAGDYRAKTELTYSNNGLFRLYGNYEILMSVESNSDDLLGNIVTDLKAMLQGKTGAAADLIARAIDSALQVMRTASTRKEIENNIRYVVAAIDAVRMLPIDAAPIRNDLDELLKFWEKKWYLAEAPR